MRTSHACLTSVLGLLAVAAPGAAPAEVGITVTPPDAQPGQAVRLTITIPVDPGFHIYAAQVPDGFYGTSVTIPSPGPVQWELPAKLPPAKPLHALGQVFQVIDPDPTTAKVRISITGVIRMNTEPGRYPLTVAVTYQVCSDKICLPPVLAKQLTSTISVSTKNIVATTAPSSPRRQPDVTTDTTTGYGSTVSLFAKRIDLHAMPVIVPLAVAFLAGVILNIMPCVLPVIPIKVLQLARDAQQSKGSMLRLSTTFCLGILTFFLAIGLAAIMLQQSLSWGQHFQNPYFLIATALLLIWLALGMFGLYQVNPPAVLARLAPNGTKYVGAFAMGLLAGILSTPCSFGILGAAVAWAQTQSKPVTLLAFALLGVGMACPYLALAAMPRLVGKIPTTGRWSELLKQTMGFLLLAVAAFLIAVLPEDRTLAVLLYAVLFALIVWLWGQVWPAPASPGSRPGKALALMVVVGLGWLMLKAPAPPLPWQPLNAQTLRIARASGDPYVVEFTADWCLNCKAIEMRVFRDPRVVAAVRDGHLRLLQADYTRRDPVIEQYLKAWTGQSGIPFTVVFRPGQRRVLLSGIYSADDLLDAAGVGADR